MLTPRQAQLLKNIEAFIRVEGHAPSNAELAGLLCLSGRGGVNRLLLQLRRKGFITWEAKRARSIALTGKSLLPAAGTLPAVRLSEKMAAEIDRIVAQHNHPSREAVVDWLLECALWSWTHGSLPPLEARHAAPFAAEAGAG